MTTLCLELGIIARSLKKMTVLEDGGGSSGLRRRHDAGPGG
jgi:hypothetical protein